MSQLPKVKTPKFSLTLKGERNITYSMFTKRDEKALLYIKEIDDKNSRIHAIADLVEERTHGTVDPKKDPKWLVEYMYLILRRDSIEPIIEFGITTEAKTIPAKIDLGKTEIEYSEVAFTGKIDLSNNMEEKTIISFSEPTIFDYSIGDDKSTQDLDLLWNCFKAVYSGDETITKEDITKDEFIEWINDLSSAAFDKINEEFNRINKVKCELEIDGEVTGLHDILNFLLLK